MLPFALLRVTVAVAVSPMTTVRKSTLVGLTLKLAEAEALHIPNMAKTVMLALRNPCIMLSP